MAKAKRLINRGVSNPSDIRLDFHFATKLAHLEAAWNGLVNKPQGQAAYSLWRDAIADAVASLPTERQVRDAVTGKLTDPFSKLRAEYPGGRKGDFSRDVQKAQEIMHSFGRNRVGLVDHLNLLEIAKGIGLPVNVSILAQLNHDAWNSSVSTHDTIEDFDLENEGDKMLSSLPSE